MSELPILEGGMLSCCLTFLRAYEGPEDEDERVRCETCMRMLTVRKGKWVWKAEDPLRPTEQVMYANFARWKRIAPRREGSRVWNWKTKLGRKRAGEE